MEEIEPIASGLTPAQLASKGWIPGQPFEYNGRTYITMDGKKFYIY